MWSYNNAIKDDPVRSGGREEAAGRGRLSRTASRPTCGRCRCSGRTTPTPAHRRADAGRSRQGRHHRRDQELRVGRVPQARCRTASTRWGCSAGPATTATPTTSSYTLLGCDAAKTERQQRLEVVLSAVRGPRPEGEDDVRPEAAHGPLHEGAGDLQGAGAVVHDRARGAVEAGAQGSDRLQALARSAGTRSTASTSRKDPRPALPAPKAPPSWRGFFFDWATGTATYSQGVPSSLRPTHPRMDCRVGRAAG